MINYKVFYKKKKKRINKFKIVMNIKKFKLIIKN